MLVRLSESIFRRAISYGYMNVLPSFGSTEFDFSHETAELIYGNKSKQIKSSIPSSFGGDFRGKFGDMQVDCDLCRNTYP